MDAREGGVPPKGVPKQYLMAWLLVMLRERNLHGYEIMKELREQFDVASDPGTIYRALRHLERIGYVSSWWESSDQGPARRVYTLAHAGVAALTQWSLALEQFRSHLDRFFLLYGKHDELEDRNLA